MTIIRVTTPAGRLTLAQRRHLSQTLTDAVLGPEAGQVTPQARVGFQVHFIERAPDMIAIGGVLIADQAKLPDVVLIDIAAMEGDWRREVRKRVIENVLAAMAEGCGLAKPAPSWWVTFRVIEEGSWGVRNGVLSILDLLDGGWFTPQRAAEIRAALKSGTSGPGPLDP